MTTLPWTSQNARDPKMYKASYLSLKTQLQNTFTKIRKPIGLIFVEKKKITRNVREFTRNFRDISRYFRVISRKNRETFAY